MTAGWKELRQRDQDLALCLLFARPRDRDLLADLLLLSLELETSIRVPSEPMLAAIRLQWWVEAVDRGSDAEAPILGRLFIHADAGFPSREQITQIIALWQDRLADERLNAGDCWGELFATMAGMAMSHGGKPADAEARETGEAARRIGRAFAGSDDAGELAECQLRPVKNRILRWLWMIGRLEIHRRRLVKDGAREVPRTGQLARHNPLLVWRMLFWRAFS